MNINDIVTVKLTEYGKQILDNYRTNLEREMRMKFKSKLRYNESGEYSTEMWNIMNMFGKYMIMGSDQVFVDNQIFLR